jgi:DNA modification methylase
MNELPKPYYQDDAVTIYHGDCRDILPLLPKVDLVLTDPPYGIGESSKKHESRGKLCNAGGYGQSDWDDRPIPQGIWDDIAFGHSIESIIWGGNFYKTQPASCWLVWDKDNGTNDFADCELAWTNIRCAVRKITYRWNGMLQEPGQPHEKRQHPTQKPLRVMAWAISKSKTTGTILDPFMGSGTTLRAAKDLKRKAIGIEIEEKYCEIAARRMAQEVLI